MQLSAKRNIILFGFWLNIFPYASVYQHWSEENIKIPISIWLDDGMQNVNKN